MSPEIKRKLPFLSIVVLAVLGLSFLAYTDHAEQIHHIKPKIAAVSKTKVTH